MLEDIQKLIHQVGQKLGLDEQTIEELIKPNAEHVFDIELDDGKVFRAYRVQHNNKNGPYKGGVRFHENVNLDEIRALATLMSLKTAAVGLPMGGGKGGVSVNPRELSKEDLEKLSRRYVAKLHSHIGPDQDVPAPDVNTNSTVIDWMVDEYEKITGDDSHASFTGKSITKGGSLGREQATGRGGVIVLREYLKQIGKLEETLSFAVQGFGNVGLFYALIAQEEQPNWKLLAAADSSATLYDQKGLSAKELAKIKQSGGHFSDYNNGSTKKLEPQKIIAQDIDVLVLAALEDSLREDNVKEVKAKCVVELANGPITNEAYRYLTDKGVIIIPDVVANSGGVTVSYLEWKQNKENSHWSEGKVNAQLEKYLVHAAKQMYQTAKAQKVPLKEAAFMNALKNLL